MNFSVPNELVELAEIFKKNKEKLYIVGGYIRNKLLGVPDEYNLDIDICSSALPEKIVKMLEKTEFKTEYMNKEIGVLEIQKNIRLEHATFRKEKYEFAGVHIPNNVEFIKNLEEDALRRDFRCNAIYYDILEEELVDPLDGFSDISDKLIRTTTDPDVVFNDDAERILRMVRFASQLGFEIDKKTYSSAVKNVSKIKLLSKTRIREEFSRIVLADTAYPNLADVKYAHARGVMTLANMGALKYILPALELIRETPIVEDRGKPLFEHVMNVFAVCDPEVRLSALLHDVGKAKSIIEFGNFNGSSDFAPIIIENNLGEEGLGFSKKIVERVKRVVLGLDFNKFGLESAKNIRHFVAKNYQDIELILKLKKAINFDKYNKQCLSFGTTHLKIIYEKMVRENTPFTLKDLDIDGNVIMKTFPQIRQNRIGMLLDALLYKCIDKPRKNNKNDLLNMAEKILIKNKQDYLEG